MDSNKVVGILHVLIIFLALSLTYFHKNFQMFNAFILLFIHTHWFICDNQCSITWLYKKFKFNKEASKDDLTELMGWYRWPFVTLAFVFYMVTFIYILKQNSIKNAYLYSLILPLSIGLSFEKIPQVFIVFVPILVWKIVQELKITTLYFTSMLLCYFMKILLQ